MKKLIKYGLIGIIAFVFLPITILLIGPFFIYKAKKAGNTKKLKIYSVATALLYGLIIISAVNTPSSPKVSGITSETTPMPTTQEEATPSPSDNKTYIRVTTVIDGDTFKIETGQSVRMIGIDTPETVDPNRPVGCLGKEASSYTKSLLEGKLVSLEKDVSETDRFGRLLRYVYLENEMFNELLVKEGFAQSSSYPPDIKYQQKFIDAQTKAREEKKGLWSDACAVTPKPQATIKPVATQKPSSTTAPSTTSINTNTSHSCTGPDLDCSDFATHSEAQSFFDSCGFNANFDPMKLDGVGVGDGVACESLP